MRDVKGDIEDLQKKLAGFGSSSSGTEKGNSNGYDINDIASNVSKELKKSEENMKNLQERMLKAEDNIQKLQEELRKMKEKRGKGDSSEGNAASGVSDQ